MTELDLIGAAALTAGAAIVVGSLVPYALATARERIGAAAAATAWFALVLLGGALQVFSPAEGSGLPALAVAVTAPVVVGILLRVALPRIRRAVAAVPLPTLIGVNLVRVLGASFILLYFGNRLPAPFAPVAGYGDIAIGLTAPLVAYLARRGGRGWQDATWLWNSLGTLDLVTAIFLGVVSAAGSPLQLIYGPISSAAIATLPWVLIPAFLVPLLFLTHLAIFGRLLRERHSHSGAIGISPFAA